MKTSWEVEENGTVHGIDVNAQEVVCWSGRPPFDSGIALSHDEFLGGRFHDSVRSLFGEDVLRQVIAVLHEMKPAVTQPASSCASTGSPLSEEDIDLSPLLPPLTTRPPVVGMRGSFFSDQRGHQGLQWRLHQDGAHQMALIDAEHLLLVRGTGATMYSTSDSEVLWDIDSAVSCCAIDPDGAWLALGWAQSVDLWDLESGTIARRLDAHDAAVTSIAFNPSRSHVATACADTKVRIWEVASGEQVAELKCVFGVTSVQFHPNGKLLLTTGEDDILRVWKWNHELGALHRNAGLTAVNPRGRLLAVSTPDEVHVHDLVSGHLAHRLPVGRCRSHAFSPGGSYLATTKGHLTVWNLGGGAELFRIPSAEGPLCFSREGERLAVCANQGVTIVSLPDGKQVARIETPLTWPVDAIAYDREGRTLAVARTDHKVALLEASRGEKLGELVGHEDRVLAVVFTEHGELVTTSTDRTVRSWDLDHGLETSRRSYAPRDDIIDCAVLSQDGRYAAISFQGARTLHLWDRTTGLEKWSAQAHDGASIRSVALHHAGRVVVTGGANSSVRLWSVPDGKRLFHEETESEVFSVVFSPDGELFSAGCRNGDVNVWQTAEGKRLHVWKAPGFVSSLAICSGNRLMAAGLIDGRVCIWDLAGGRPSRILSGHIARVTALSFSPDGCYLTSGSQDQTVRTWQLLYEAAAAGDLDRVRRLLGSGADVDVAAADGTVPLDLAVIENREDLVDLLLEFGADPGKPDENGYTPFMIAVRLGKHDIARAFLEKGADVNQSTVKGFTPLMMAARLGNIDMVKLLLSHGAVPNRANEHGETALTIASSQGHQDVALLLGIRVRESPPAR